MVGKSKKLPDSRPYNIFSNDTLVQAVQDCKKILSLTALKLKYNKKPVRV